MSVAAVLAGELPWHVEQADCLAFLAGLPDDSVDLILTSPPYVQARLYKEKGQDLGIARKPDEWVSWMLQVCEEARRVCKGLCAFVVEGQTKNYSYDCTPFLLLADLKRRGFNLRKPPVYRRVGIPGSGGPDWLRNDWEPVLCFSRKGRLPWSDPTACGHVPVYGVGGEISHRLLDGTRVDEKRRLKGKGGGGRAQDGSPKHGEAWAAKGFTQPELANPGNVIEQRTYSAEEVEALLGGCSDMIDCDVGGGTMGSRLAHENEAPFAEELAQFFVLSFCPPGGIVCEPFAGSGTTLAMAIANGRRTIGCDLRESQVELTKRRLGAVTPTMFPEVSVPRHCSSSPNNQTPTLFPDSEELPDDRQ